MVRKYLLFFAVFLVIASVSALDTKIYVTTYSNTEVSINVLDPASSSSFLSIDGLADISGNAVLNFTPDRMYVGMYVMIRRSGSLIMAKKFENVATNAPINLRMIKEEPVVNTTPPATAVVNITVDPPAAPIVNISTDTSGAENSAPITGNAVVSENSGIKIPSFVYYILGGVVLIGLLGYVGFKFFRRDSYAGISSQSSVKTSVNMISNKELMEAERKLKLAQEEIDKIKHKKSRLDEAQRNFEVAKKELDKAKKDSI